MGSTSISTGWRWPTWTLTWLALGLGVVFEAWVGVPQGLADASAFLVPVALVFAVAEAVAGELLAALPVALAVPVALALRWRCWSRVLVAVVLPVGLALLLAGLALVLLSAGLLAVAAGVAVGLGDLLASCEGDGEELDGHAVAVALARLLGRLLGLAPPTDELIGLAPNPSVPGVPLLLSRGKPYRRADLPQGLAQRRHRQGDADGEHRAGRRQGRPEQYVPPVPRLARA